jgi:hypothetical protein
MSYEVPRFIPPKWEDHDNGQTEPSDRADLDALRYERTRSPIGRAIAAGMSVEPYLHPLWQHLHDEHGLTLVESELEEVLDVCQRIARRDAPVGAGPPKEEQVGGGKRIAELSKAMTYERAEELAPGTDYAFEATHQDENPIHWPDATAFFLEGYHRALQDMEVTS